MYVCMYACCFDKLMFGGYIGESLGCRSVLLGETSYRKIPVPVACTVFPPLLCNDSWALDAGPKGRK